MKLVLTAVFDEDDGHGEGEEVTYIREGVDDMTSFAQAMVFFANATGYTYVTDAGFTSDNGNEWWGYNF